MHIDRKLSTVMMVIDRIYHPIAENMGISLLLRNEINTERQFPPKFFINLIQITGNLVAIAVKLTYPTGLVGVVLSMSDDEDFSTLNITVTNTGKIISPDLISAFNDGEQVAKLIGSEEEPGLDFRLKYVMKLVSEEGGQIFMKSGKDSETTFALSFPLTETSLDRRNEFHSFVHNGAALLNGF